MRCTCTSPPSGRSLLRMRVVPAGVASVLLATDIWFCSNLLSLNIKKTNYIIFGNKTLPDVNLMLNNQIITRVYETKFLGVMIQANLKWNSHVSLLVNKMSKTIGIMNKVKYILGTTHLKIIYQSLIEPYINYCCIVWGGISKTSLLDTLHKIQKKALRIATYSPYRSHSRPLFYKLGYLNIYDICLTQILVFVYRSTNSLLPMKYNNYFTCTNRIHSHMTRSSESKLYIVSAHKSCRLNTLRIRGPRLWNALNESLRETTPLTKFKKELKLTLLTKYNCLSL
jgi:hypothetical protein